MFLHTRKGKAGAGDPQRGLAFTGGVWGGGCAGQGRAVRVTVFGLEVNITIISGRLACFSPAWKWNLLTGVLRSAQLGIDHAAAVFTLALLLHLQALQNASFTDPPSTAPPAAERCSGRMAGLIGMK